MPIFVGSSPAWQMDNVKDDLQETHGNPHVYLLNPCLQPIQNLGYRPWIIRPGPHPRMIFRPALWQIHFNLFQPPWNPPKRILQIPKTPSKESSNKQRNPKKYSPNQHPARPACLTNVCSRAKPTAAPSPTAGCAWRTLRPPSPPGTAPRRPSWWTSAMAGGSGYGREVGRCGKVYENYAIKMWKSVTIYILIEIDIW